jgi:hydrogenase maturation protease
VERARKRPRPKGPLRTKPRGRRERTLVYGYGNPGRSDDGLGPAVASWLEREARRRGRRDIVALSRLQLNIEDSLTVSAFDRVVFVDATRRGPDPFLFRDIRPARGWSFSTHALSPEAVLALCAELYGKRPPASMLAVRGHRWVLGEAFSPAAERNLARAGAFLARRLGLGARPGRG